MPDEQCLVVDTYDGLRRLLNERRMSLKMSMLQLDEVAGLADGHGSKLLCGARNLGTVSLPLILGALGVKIALVEIPRGGRTFAIRAIKRDAFLRKRMSAIARKGGKARRASMTTEEWAVFCAKARSARADKLALKKQMTELSVKGVIKANERRSKIAAAAQCLSLQGDEP